MKIFISYAKEDVDYAERMYDSLSKMEDLSPWIDRKNLLPGVRWKDEIIATIGESRFVVLILSSRSVSKTGFVQKEFRAALDRLSHFPPKAVFIIPARVELCEPQYSELRELQYVDMFPDWEQGARNIRRTIKAHIHEDLVTVFKGLSHNGRHYAHGEEQNWLEEHGETILGHSSTSLVEAIDSAYTVYSGRMHALRMLASLAKEQKSNHLLPFVIHMHDVAKLCVYSHEIPEYYGILLYGASLLDRSARALFLRSVVDFWCDHLYDYSRGDWWSDLAFRDLVKHFMAAEASTYIAGQTYDGNARYSTANSAAIAFTKWLPLLSWDVARADLLTHLAIRNQRPALLLCVVHDILLSFGRGAFREEEQARWRPRIPVSKAEEMKAQCDRYSAEDAARQKADLRYADYREDRHRLGIMLRCGEYLSQEEQSPGLAEYGNFIKSECFKILARHNQRIATLICNLSADQARRLFSVIENQLSSEIGNVCDGIEEEDAETLLDFVPWSSKCFLAGGKEYRIPLASITSGD